MSSVATATMTEANTSSMAKYYASKIGELSEVSVVVLNPWKEEQVKG
jgi:hypothetical protein